MWIHRLSYFFEDSTIQNVSAKTQTRLDNTFVSVYLSFLLCFTGLHIVYTQDEVDVVQNLMFYIESAYKVAVSKHTSSFHTHNQSHFFVL